MSLNHYAVSQYVIIVCYCQGKMVVLNIDVVLKSVLRSYIHSLGKYETKRNCKC